MQRTQTAIRPAATKETLRRAWLEEMGLARTARDRDDSVGEWGHLERAHILSQPMAMPHVRTHLAMIGSALRRHDRREIAGQLVRLILAGPGSLTGRYPVGNTGGANVSAFTPMPIPDDLLAILDGEPEEATR